MTERGNQQNAAAAGSFALEGGPTVNRLGFGSMRLTGEGIWGAPTHSYLYTGVHSQWPKTVSSLRRVG